MANVKSKQTPLIDRIQNIVNLTGATSTAHVIPNKFVGTQLARSKLDKNVQDDDQKRTISLATDIS